MTHIHLSVATTTNYLDVEKNMCFFVSYFLLYIFFLFLSPFNCILSSIQLAFLWRVKLARSSCLSHPYSCCGLDEYIYFRKNLRLSFYQWPPGRFSKLLHTHTHVSGPVYNHRVRLTQKQNSFPKAFGWRRRPTWIISLFLSFFFRKKLVQNFLPWYWNYKSPQQDWPLLMMRTIQLYIFRFCCICSSVVFVSPQFFVSFCELVVNTGVCLFLCSFSSSLCSAFSSSSYVVKLNEVSAKSSVPVYSPGAFKRIRVY